MSVIAMLLAGASVLVADDIALVTALSPVTLTRNASLYGVLTTTSKLSLVVVMPKVLTISLLVLLAASVIDVGSEIFSGL